MILLTDHLSADEIRDMPPAALKLMIFICQHNEWPGSEKLMVQCGFTKHAYYKSYSWLRDNDYLDESQCRTSGKFGEACNQLSEHARLRFDANLSCTEIPNTVDRPCIEIPDTVKPDTVKQETAKHTKDTENQDVEPCVEKPDTVPRLEKQQAVAYISNISIKNKELIQRNKETKKVIIKAKEKKPADEKPVTVNRARFNNKYRVELPDVNELEKAFQDAHRKLFCDPKSPDEYTGFRWMKKYYRPMDQLIKEIAKNIRNHWDKKTPDAVVPRETILRGFNRILELASNDDWLQNHFEPCKINSNYNQLMNRPVDAKNGKVKKANGHHRVLEQQYDESGNLV